MLDFWGLPWLPLKVPRMVQSGFLPCLLVERNCQAVLSLQSPLPSSHGVLPLGLHMVLSLHVCVHISFFYKDPSLIGLGTIQRPHLNLMKSSWILFPNKGPVQWSVGDQVSHWSFWRGVIQPIAGCKVGNWSNEQEVRPAHMVRSRVFSAVSGYSVVKVPARNCLSPAFLPCFQGREFSAPSQQWMEAENGRQSLKETTGRLMSWLLVWRCAVH